MADFNTEQWQAERLEHWLVREWARAFAEKLSESGSGDPAREVELDPREPQLEKWQAWEEPLWFDLASDVSEEALVSVGCAKSTADPIAAAIAGEGEDAHTRDIYVEFLNKIRVPLSEAAGGKLGCETAFAEAQKSECPEHVDLGVEYAFQLEDTECVLAFVPSKALLEAIQPAQQDEAREEQQESGENEQPAGDEAAEQDETAQKDEAQQQDAPAEQDERASQEEAAEQDEPPGEDKQDSDQKLPEQEETEPAGEAQPKAGDKSATSDKKVTKDGEQAQTNLSMLLDIELDLSVSFGKTELPMQEVLKLASGSIVELNRGVSEPVEVMVNNCVIARGEVVVVEGNYGIRITEILSRKERIRSIL